MSMATFFVLIDNIRVTNIHYQYISSFDRFRVITIKSILLHWNLIVTSSSSMLYRKLATR